MTKRPTDSLFTCPDCGGILEPSRPTWVDAIDFAVAAEPKELGPAHWRCFICGYHADPPKPPGERALGA